MMQNKYSGKVLDGRYEIISLLGEGGMGAVYLGRHVKLGRSVAVKFLHGELTRMKDVVARFYREAQAASGISHPNIIDVYDVGVAEWGEPYLVMEYLSGENLASLLQRKGPISLGAACGIMEPVLRALHAAHERGIVHRDLKPDNIFLMRQDDAPPIIKVIDFGISKFLETEQTKLTRTGALLGTPSYMSPEQARGRGTFDHRADIYAMGVVLHYMLCGNLPFVGESYNDLIVNILTEPVKKPSETYPDFPAEAEPIVMRLLEKDPERRFGTCLELLEALMSLDAFAQRNEALAALTADMPESCFATGDLGDTNESFDAIAATLYAELGTPEGETVWDKPAEDESALANKPSASAKPSSAPRAEGKKRRSGALLFGGVFFVVGIAISLYATGLFSEMTFNRPDSTDIPAVAPPEVPATPAPAKKNPDDSPVIAPHTNKESGDTLSASADSGQDTDGTDGASDSEAVEGPTDGVPMEPAAATKNSLVTDSTLASPTGETPAGAKPLTPTTGADAGAATDGASGKSPVNVIINAASGQGDDASAKPAGSSSQESGAIDTADNGDDLFPLTPEAINRLLEARHGKVMTCYDLARAKTPELSGILELQVGMSGSAVEVTVTGGNVSGFLSECVIKVIKSIRVPPNDGTLVEILKEYEFR